MEGDVRGKILEAARCIFLKEGYKGTTINSIVRAVEISPSTIYLHFNGKEDLFGDLDISEEGALWDAYNANRTSILQTAPIFFGEHGYDEISMDMLTRESGYSKATLCQYLKDKGEFYLAVMWEIPFYFNFPSIWPEVDGHNLEAAIKKIGLAYLAAFSTPERIAFTRTIIRDSKRYPEVSSIYHKNGVGYVARRAETVSKKYTGNLQEGVNLYLAAKTYMDPLFGPATQYKIVAGVEPQYEDDKIIDMLAKILLHEILH